MALLGVATLSAAITAMLVPKKAVVVHAAAQPTRAATVAKPRRRPTHAAEKAAPLRVALAQLRKTARPAKPHVSPPVAPNREPVRPRTTPSLYERTTSPSILREQGCRAGAVRTSGLVILDFGKPAYRRHTYGTISFSGRFASNTSITWAMKAYARGYHECLPQGSSAKIILVRGTSNYRPSVPSDYRAGQLWAKETVAVAGYLRLHHFDGHVQSAAGDDAEPAWDRTFRRTYDFFRGFRSAARGYLLYNYGSLDGGPGGIWKVRQAYYVAAGMRFARAVPEIYNRAMAQQWAYLSRLSVERFGKPLEFAGVMTQHHKRCRRCGFTAAQAHSALVDELAKSPETAVRGLAAVTNIGSPAPPQR